VSVTELVVSARVSVTVSATPSVVGVTVVAWSVLVSVVVVSVLLLVVSELLVSDSVGVGSCATFSDSGGVVGVSSSEEQAAISTKQRRTTIQCKRFRIRMFFLFLFSFHNIRINFT
jgi:hypothetical protein